MNTMSRLVIMVGVTLLSTAGVSAADTGVVAQSGSGSEPELLSTRIIGFGSGSGMGAGGAFGNAGSIGDGVVSFAVETGIGSQSFGGGFQAFGVDIDTLGISGAGPLAGDLGGIELAPVINSMAPGIDLPVK